MLLADRSAVIYGGGGAIGGAVARIFAREGAQVFLAGRTAARLEAVADDIRAAGGTAHTAVVDALDGRAVNEHADQVAATAGGIDISFSLISQNDVQGTPLVEMSLEDFEQPVLTTLRSTLLTAQAAARHMIRARSGVILVFGGNGDPPRGHNVGGLMTAFGAQEALRRQLATELGPHGIRVLTLQTGGIVDTLPTGEPWAADIAAELTGKTLLGRAATREDVGNVAAFAASDLARSMTATALNITAGAEVD